MIDIKYYKLQKEKIYRKDLKEELKLCKKLEKVIKKSLKNGYLSYEFTFLYDSYKFNLFKKILNKTGINYTVFDYFFGIFGINIHIDLRGIEGLNKYIKELEYENNNKQSHSY